MVATVWAILVAWAAMGERFLSERVIGSVDLRDAIITTLRRTLAVYDVVLAVQVLPLLRTRPFHLLWKHLQGTEWDPHLWPAPQVPVLLLQLLAVLVLEHSVASNTVDLRVPTPYRLVWALRLVRTHRSILVTVKAAGLTLQDLSTVVLPRLLSALPVKVRHLRELLTVASTVVWIHPPTPSAFYPLVLEA